MQKRMYLVENSGKTSGMVGHLKTLLESYENNDLQLAFQLLKNGGVPQSLLTHLLSISKWHWDKSIRRQAQRLLDSSAPERFKRYIMKYWKKHFNTEFSEIKISQMLSRLSKSSYINKNTLALMSLKLRKRGGKFCLEETNINPKTVLQELIEANELYLANFELKKLPEDIGSFTQIKSLNISGNQFTELPAEVTYLKNLQYLDYQRTPLSENSVKLLEISFSSIFAVKYYNIAYDLKSDEHYLEASHYFIKSVTLDADFAEAWHQFGANLMQAGQKHEAEKSLTKAIQLYDKRLSGKPKSTKDWFWKARAYALLEQKEKAFDTLKACLVLDQSYKQKTKLEEDFQAYYGDSEFLKLVE